MLLLPPATAKSLLYSTTTTTKTKRPEIRFHLGHNRHAPEMYVLSLHLHLTTAEIRRQFPAKRFFVFPKNTRKTHYSASLIGWLQFNANEYERGHISRFFRIRNLRAGHNVLHVSSLGVDPLFRSLGLAKLLLNKFIQIGEREFRQSGGGKGPFYTLCAAKFGVARPWQSYLPMQREWSALDTRALVEMYSKFGFYLAPTKADLARAKTKAQASAVRHQTRWNEQWGEPDGVLMVRYPTQKLKEDESLDRCCRP
jgi:GNAT superfamily N-acetyltransferase